MPKKLFTKIYPELSASKGKTDQDQEDMEEALKVCWAAIRKARFDVLYLSYYYRIKTVIAADRWQTKY
jgi:hypothetical protein